jgi:hypothetical protein
MRTDTLDHAIELLEKCNADLVPELLTAAMARELLSSYARIEKLAAFGIAALTPKISDSTEVAWATGTRYARVQGTRVTNL